MAQPINGTKELNLKPEAFNGNRDNFKKFLKNVEVYMDVNHETYNSWYEWAATLDHQFYKVNRAIEQTRGNSRKEKTPQRKYYFLQKERDLNAMDINRLTVDECNKLMKEGRCFKCRNMGHQANECPKMMMTRRKARKCLKRR
jgi:hypothetical protein